jgi:polyhydroxyalkanoate synthase
VTLVALAAAACGRKTPPVASPPAAANPDLPQDSWVRTEDGATVALRRYPANGPPVVLVHGISSNHRTWDLDAERSLARALQAQGLDAWLLDLRGHGLARRDGQGHPQRSGWTMDDYGRYDLPAAIDHVRQESGHDRVGYVGHSMGGMVAAIYTTLHGDAALSSLVVVGSPVDFGQPEPLLRLARAGGPVATIGGTLPTPALARAAALLDRSPLFVDPLLFNPANVSAQARRDLYRSIVSPLSRGEVAQLRQMIAQGAFRSRDGQVDYLAGLSALRVPLLVIAGRGDSVAPVDRVAPWIEASGSPVEELVVASRANGFQHDYGHLDLAMGDAAPAELYPRIITWVQEGAARAP